MGKKNNVKLYKVELNDRGDFIEISTADTELFDRFVETYIQISDAAKDLLLRRKEIDKDCTISGNREKNMRKIRANVRFCEESSEKIDCVFGQGTLRKYFRRLYEEVPYFLPGTECFIDFFKQMAPALECFFERKINEKDKAYIMSMLQDNMIR